MTDADLLADIAYLAARAENAGRCVFSASRDFGISSNAIVRLAYGGAAPTADELPMDRDDYVACVRAVGRLPAHRKTPAVHAAMRKAELAWLKSEGVAL